MVTERQQKIYNLYLRESRRGQPYKLRKNFDKMPQETIVLLEKIDKFFNDHPIVDWESFFKAPHELYPDDSTYKLDFYVTQRAKKVYASYMKSLELEDPDSQDSLLRLRDSLKYVFEFCQEHDLTFTDYPTYCEDGLPLVIDHLKNHKINYYTLHSLGISRLNIEQSILDFIFGDFYGTLQKTKNKFFSSTKMKEFSKQANAKLQTKLKETQTN